MIRVAEHRPLDAPVITTVFLFMAFLLSLVTTKHFLQARDSFRSVAGDVTNDIDSVDYQRHAV